MMTILFNRAIRRSTRALRLERGETFPAPKARSRLVRALDLASKAALRAVILFHLWYVGVTALVVVCFAFVDPAATTLSMYRKYIDGWKITRPVPVSLERVPRTARRMLVSVEDSTFFTHHGIEFEAFQRAMEINQQIGRPMYGGSTLTMQTARTLFLVPFKSYLRKYLELIVTFELELFLPKDRILELYFSWAEWGKGVFGIEAASRKYFRLSVARLDPTQTASLIAVLSSPIRFVPATLAKSRILSSRYEFLLDRYVR